VPTPIAIGVRVASNLPPARPGEAPALTWFTIVGVVGSTPLRTLTDTLRIPQLYVPMSNGRGPGAVGPAQIGPGISTMSYVLRTRGAPLDVIPSVRRAVAEFDRHLALFQPRTLQRDLDRASAQTSFTMSLLAIAASVALVLGVIGTYGVRAYIVRQRTGEIGVRLALGAQPSTVARQIVRQGGVIAAAGVVVGLAAALAGGRLIESLLYGVTPRDSCVFATTAIGLLTVALVACWIPARRAARLNPETFSAADPARAERASGTTPLHRKFSACHHARQHRCGMPERAHAVRREEVVLPRASALHRLRRRQREVDQLLVAQPAERRIDGADHDVASRPPLDLLPNPNPVRIVAQMDDREHDVQLELADEIPFGHYYDKRVVRRSPRGPGLDVPTRCGAGRARRHRSWRRPATRRTSAVHEC
jgi:FtsX-like permease family protein